MNVLEMYDKRVKRKDCVNCLHHVTRQGTASEIHFCEVSGKILLYPLYLPNKCKKYKGEKI